MHTINSIFVYMKSTFPSFNTIFSSSLPCIKLQQDREPRKMRLSRNCVAMNVHKNWVVAVRRSFRFGRSSDSLKRASSINGVRCNWVGAVKRRWSHKSSSNETIIVFNHTNDTESFANEPEEENEKTKEQLPDSKEVAVIVFHPTKNKENDEPTKIKETILSEHEDEPTKIKETILSEHKDEPTKTKETILNEQEDEGKEKKDKEQSKNSKEVTPGVDDDDVGDAASDGSFSSMQELLLIEEDLAAIKIQAFFRAHLARRAYQALRTFVKLQTLVRGFNICL